MDEKRINRMWVISLFTVGIATMILVGYSLYCLRYQLP